MPTNSLKPATALRLTLLAAATFASFGFEGGCDDCNKPDPVTCTPACGTGYTCENGTCVGSCKATSCPSGICATPTTCAQCATDTQCSGATPRCSMNRCVACVAGPTDNCSASAYCDGASNTCTRGCKNNGACASNSCSASHDCAQCTSDNECSLGKVCNAGTCEAPCASSASCGGDRVCCGSKCQDGSKDDACHACNVTCSATQFCGSAACVTTTVGQLCELSKVTLVKDGDGNDDVNAAAAGAALAARCGRTIAVTSVAQTSADVLDQTTGRPLAAPGTLLVFSGGTFFNAGTRYFVESPGLSKIYDTIASDGTTIAIRRRPSGTDVLLIDPSTLNAGHDFFIIEMLKEPTTKAVALVFYGLNAPGTYAAAWYLENRVIPMRAVHNSTYYVVEWTDQNGDNDPNMGDRFDLQTND